MREWILAQVPTGIDLLLILQSWRHPLLNGLMQLITDLNGEQFGLFLVPIVLWCIHKELGRGLTYIALSVFYANGILKNWLQIPRPFAAEFQSFNQKLVPLRHEDSFSWPSGHSQNAVAMWGYLALRVKKWWFVALMVMLALLVGFSRMYIGVHTYVDVISGWTVGAVCLALGLWLEPQLRAGLGRLSLGGQMVWAAIIPILLTLLAPYKDTTMTAGALMGLSVGFVLESRYVRYTVQGVWWRRVLRAIVGLLILFPIYLGSSALSPEVDALWLMLTLRFARYALLGLIMAFFAPWVFVKTGLAPAQEGSARQV